MSRALVLDETRFLSAHHRYHPLGERVGRLGPCLLLDVADGKSAATVTTWLDARP